VRYYLLEYIGEWKVCAAQVRGSVVFTDYSKMCGGGVAFTDYFKESRNATIACDRLHRGQCFDHDLKGKVQTVLRLMIGRRVQTRISRPFSTSTQATACKHCDLFHLNTDHSLHVLDTYNIKILHQE
jgi:hypothetical protein